MPGTLPLELEKEEAYIGKKTSDDGQPTKSCRQHYRRRLQPTELGDVKAKETVCYREKSTLITSQSPHMLKTEHLTVLLELFGCLRLNAN